MASLKAREAPPCPEAWSNRWLALVGIGIHRAIAESLLRHAGVDLLHSAPVDPVPPLTDVLQEA